MSTEISIHHAYQSDVEAVKEWQRVGAPEVRILFTSTGRSFVVYSLRVGPIGLMVFPTRETDEMFGPSNQISGEDWDTAIQEVTVEAVEVKA